MKYFRDVVTTVATVSLVIVTRVIVTAVIITRVTITTITVTARNYPPRAQSPAHLKFQDPGYKYRTVKHIIKFIKLP